MGDLQIPEQKHIPEIYHDSLMNHVYVVSLFRIITANTEVFQTYFSNIIIMVGAPK